MHKDEDLHNCLTAVLTAVEAAVLWGLSRNSVSDACRRSALRGRKSGKTLLVTVLDMIVYLNGRYWPDLIPNEIKPALDEDAALMEDLE